MKNTIIICVLFCAIILLNISCTKDETNTNSNSPNGCNLTVIKSQNETDSIVYLNNQINKINHYTNNTGFGGSSLKLQSTIRLDYINSSEIKVYELSDYWGTGWIEELSYILILKDSKLSQIKSGEGELWASYYYDGNKLKYFLYNDLIDNYTIATDSFVVKYDTKGNNIIEMKWFAKTNPTEKIYTLLDTFNYIFDDKNNPYRSSTYFVINYSEEEELSLDFFNLNNILSVDSYNRSYSYNEKNYPVYVDSEADGRTYFTYQCK
jgi:hypothetical protein